MTGGPNELKIAPKNVSAKAPTTCKLSAEQLQFYRDHGFLVIKKFIDFDVLHNCKQYFIEACNDKVNIEHLTVVKEKSLANKYKKKEDYINKVLDIHNDQVFATYTEHPRLLDVIAQLIGDEIMVINSMLVNKPPGAARHSAHQDMQYLPYRPADRITATWTAVDEANTSNGCLWVVPGSHKANILYQHERKQGGIPLLYGITDKSIASLDKRVHLELSPGDTVFIHSLLVHGSGANNSKDYRKSLVGHYVNAQCECVDLRGTSQDAYVREWEESTWRQRVGTDFLGYWRIKSKKLSGKSKL